MTDDPDGPETPNGSVSAEPGALRVPAHGNGLIRHGGNPGNRGGYGDAPDWLRKQLRGSFRERIPILEAIADDTEARDRDRIAALDTMARYGGIVGAQLSPDDVRDRLKRTVDAIRHALPDSVAAPLLSTLRRVWSD